MSESGLILLTDPLEVEAVKDINKDTNRLIIILFYESVSILLTNLLESGINLVIII